MFEDSRVLVNDCGTKDGLEGEFIRIACRTAEDNDRLVETFKRLTKFAEADKADAVEVR
jgi:histidinol-phosphate/aromatic aminotransferase/cobyric acid decarboxylase-like protein